MTSCLDLPTEIHLELSQFLQPRHVNNLIQTCRTMHLRLNAVLWKPATTTATERERILIDAASKGNLTAVKKIFVLSADHGTKFSAKVLHQALELAVTGGNDAVVDHLLNKRMKYTFEARHLDPAVSHPCALQAAAENGRLELFELLLERRHTVREKARALKSAVKRGHDPIVKVLLDNEDQDLLKTHTISPQHCLLHTAIRGKFQSIVTLLLNHGVCVDKRDSPGGHTPLMVAIQEEWPWAVERLLSGGANVHLTLPEGVSVLQAAIKGRRTPENLEIVRLLRNHGCDLTYRDSSGQTSVAFAIGQGRLDILYMVFADGITLHIVEDKDSLLSAAAKNGDENLTMELINMGVNLNQSSLIGSNEWPALNHAAFENHVHIMKFLHENGANLDPPGSNWPNPLQLALGQGHVDAAKWLLENGVGLDFTVRPPYPWKNFTPLSKQVTTPLHFAALGGMETFQLVLRHDYAVLPWQKQDVRSLWETAALGRGSNNRGLYWLVYDLCCDVTTGDYLDPIRPEQYLLQNMWRESVTIAIVHASHILAALDLGTTNADGQTLLHLAVKYHKLLVVEYLLGNGAPVNCRDEHGHTAIYYAVEQHDADTAHALLGCGAGLLIDQQHERQPMWVCIFPDPAVSGRACERDSESIDRQGATLRVLVNHGGDLDFLYRGRTFLHHVISDECFPNEAMRKVRLLFSLGANPNIVDCYGETPIQVAEGRGLDRLVDLFLRKLAGLEID
ncbi:ankyrin repeat-containing domain protein [Aspergillus unguis]